VGTGVQGVATQGSSVSLSADGNAVLIGGYNDNATTGAAWVFGKSVDPVPNLKNKADHCFYPSPISRGQLLTLVLPNCNSSTSYSIEFLDLSGRVVLTQRGGVASGVSEELMISVSSLASGTYLARYTTCDRTQTCRVLIKE
jgi:Ca2+-binding RTX toxin-like protein